MYRMIHLQILSIISFKGEGLEVRRWPKGRWWMYAKKFENQKILYINKKITNTTISITKK